MCTAHLALVLGISSVVFHYIRFKFMVAIVTLISIMVAVAFFTLLERKVLGYIHMRKGPNKPRVLGVFVPFADAIKLFVKELNYPNMCNKFTFISVSVLIISVPILLWYINPINSIAADLKLMLLIIIAVRRVGVYGTLGAGWRRNRKFSIMGRVRAVAQTISYEVSMTVVVLLSVYFFYYDISINKQLRCVS